MLRFTLPQSCCQVEDIDLFYISRGTDVHLQVSKYVLMSKFVYFNNELAKDPELTGLDMRGLSNVEAQINLINHACGNADSLPFLGDDSSATTHLEYIAAGVFLGVSSVILQTLIDTMNVDSSEDFALVKRQWDLLSRAGNVEALKVRMLCEECDMPPIEQPPIYDIPTVIQAPLVTPCHGFDVAYLSMYAPKVTQDSYVSPLMRDILTHMGSPTSFDMTPLLTPEYVFDLSEALSAIGNTELMTTFCHTISNAPYMDDAYLDAIIDLGEELETEDFLIICGNVSRLYAGTTSDSLKKLEAMAKDAYVDHRLEDLGEKLVTTNLMAGSGLQFPHKIPMLLPESCNYVGTYPVEDFNIHIYVYRPQPGALSLINIASLRIRFSSFNGKDYEVTLIEDTKRDWTLAKNCGLDTASFIPL